MPTSALRLFVALALPAVLAAVAPVARGDGPLFVLLRPEAEVGDRVVRIAHVADVSGGTDAQRTAVRALDLAERPAAGARLAITRDQVKFRVLLEGHDRRAVVVGGTSRCAVTRGRELISSDEIAKAARTAIVARVPEFARQSDVKIVETPKLPALDLNAKDQVRLVGQLAPGRLPLGRTRAEVLVHVNGVRRAVVPVDVDVVPAAAVVPATVSTPAPVAAPTKNSPVAIKRLDRVKMVVPLNGVYVMAGGEAQQDGRSGQMIRVRNLDSGRVIQARVLGPGYVQVEY